MKNFKEFLKLIKESNHNNTSEHEHKYNYMIMPKLEKMRDQINQLINLGQDQLNTMDYWAVDHLTTSADDIDEVHTYLIYNESKKKINPKYLTGPTKADQKRMKEEIKKHSDKKDDDSSAYQKWPADDKHGNTDNEPHKTKQSKATLAYNKMYAKNESKEVWETSLKNKSEDTGIPLRYLKQIYNRGLAAWKTGHRPGASQHQWTMGRVNSWITGVGKARTTDKDVWDKYQDWKKDS